ncbi:nickel-dependent hydrogenase [mine drainage metagenome]|uniref:Nickel-dependent hydrogenase n=1 Tax=mine drainage metagenome TaxID=410659 RepID=A0A1J5QXH1_9ZZZZ
MSGFPAEGRLDIAVTVAQGRFTAVRVASSRALALPSLFSDRRAAEIPELCSRLYAVCRIAQGLAAAKAVEQAADFEAPPPQRAARRLLLLAETLLDQGGRALLDWPRLLGEAPDAAACKDLRAALAGLPRLLYPETDWMRPGGGRLAPDGAALAESLRRARAVIETKVLAGQGARLAAHLRAEGLEEFGACTLPALPPWSARDVAQGLAWHDAAFIAAPTWRGMPHRTGALARLEHHPALAGAGSGLMGLLRARLTELALALDSLDGVAAGGLAADPGQTPPEGDGVGTAVVEAARGRLAHRVEIAGGRVRRYAILAPTEWTFHPQGALVKGLLGADAGPDPLARAGLLAALLDPCVPCRVTDTGTPAPGP